MKRICILDDQIPALEPVNLRLWIRVSISVVFLSFLGLGIGAVSMLPWLSRTGAMSCVRAEAMAENMLDQAAKCESRVMVLEKACPLAVRARAVTKNIGGETGEH